MNTAHGWWVYVESIQVSLLSSHIHISLTHSTYHKTDPKLAKRKDDDGRYAIHWAASSNNFDIVLLLADLSGFDPDVQVSSDHLGKCFQNPASWLTVHVLVNRMEVDGRHS